jgi:hypothetical protein
VAGPNDNTGLVPRLGFTKWKIRSCALRLYFSDVTFGLLWDFLDDKAEGPDSRGMCVGTLGEYITFHDRYIYGAPTPTLPEEYLS